MRWKREAVLVLIRQQASGRLIVRLGKHAQKMMAR